MQKHLPVIILCCALAGILGGGALISMAALGGCLIFVSLAAAVYALAMDDGQPTAHEVGGSVMEVLDRFRGAA